MKRALVALLAGCMAMMIATAAVAGWDNGPASISTHVGPSVTKLPCDNQPALDRYTISTSACPLPGETRSVWIMVCNGSDSLGVAGMEFGIQYDGAPSSGIDVNSWTLCGDLDFPNAGWPDSGIGTIITWEPNFNCQNQTSEPFVPGSVIAIGGVLDVTYYSPDQLTITPRPVSGRAKVADCNSAETDITTKSPSQLGVAAFCAGPGYNPCFLPTPTEETTWGRIKSNY